MLLQDGRLRHQVAGRAAEHHLTLDQDDIAVGDLGDVFPVLVDDDAADAGAAKPVEEALLKSEFNANAKVDVGRFKGLGEMMPAQLKETTMDPARRTLLRVVLLADDREGTADSVERLMGTKAEARFAFISDKAEFASDGHDVALDRILTEDAARAIAVMLCRGRNRLLCFHSCRIGDVQAERRDRSGDQPQQREPQ